MVELKIGLVGLDTSHVVAFAKCFNDPKHAEHIPGARITVAFPGGSPDFDLSWNRMPGFTKQLTEEFGVETVDSPEAVAEQVDLVFIMSVDGRVHREQFARTVKFRRPTFIDKPLAADLKDAREIARLAREAGVPWFSSSVLRYSPAVAALRLADANGVVAWSLVLLKSIMRWTSPGTGSTGWRLSIR
jgi:predicted dehydrogenase